MFLVFFGSLFLPCDVQVAAFLQAGLAGAGAQCSSICANPFTPATVGPVLNRSSAAKAAEKVLRLFPLPCNPQIEQHRQLGMIDT